MQRLLKGRVLWKVWGGWRWYYTWPAIWWKRVWLWCRLVGRINQADYRTGPVIAWQVACIVWDVTDHVSARRNNATAA